VASVSASSVSCALRPCAYNLCDQPLQGVTVSAQEAPQPAFEGLGDVPELGASDWATPFGGAGLPLVPPVAIAAMGLGALILATVEMVGDLLLQRCLDHALGPR